MYTTLIDVHHLAEEIADNSNLLLLDCRFDLANPEKGYLDYEKGHLPDAFYVDLEKNLSGFRSGKNGRHPLPNREVCAKFFVSLGLNLRSQVVVYDQGNMMFAARAWWILRWLGHEVVAVLDGGLKEWLRLGGRLSKENPFAIASKWQVEEPLVRIANIGEVKKNLETQEFLVVDARVRERFYGEESELDRRPGHIPKAKNYFFAQNIDENGLFKQPDELKKQWQEILEGRNSAEVIHQCGSGVSACVNILAMEHANLPGSILYVGSWSEWVEDENHPIAIA